jgi:hypothetical protein
MYHVKMMALVLVAEVLCESVPLKHNFHILRPLPSTMISSLLLLFQQAMYHVKMMVLVLVLAVVEVVQ